MVFLKQLKQSSDARGRQEDRALKLCLNEIKLLRRRLLLIKVKLTLYRAASDPTYLERGGRNQPAPQFSVHGAPIGQMMIPPQTFSVNVVYKKRIGSIGQKLGPWPQFKNFIKLANLVES